MHHDDQGGAGGLPGERQGLAGGAVLPAAAGGGAGRWRRWLTPGGHVGASGALTLRCAAGVTRAARGSPRGGARGAAGSRSVLPVRAWRSPPCWRFCSFGSSVLLPFLSRPCRLLPAALLREQTIAFLNDLGCARG